MISLLILLFRVHMVLAAVLMTFYAEREERESVDDVAIHLFSITS